MVVLPSVFVALVIPIWQRIFYLFCFLSFLLLPSPPRRKHKALLRNQRRPSRGLGSRFGNDYIPCEFCIAAPAARTPKTRTPKIATRIHVRRDCFSGFPACIFLPRRLKLQTKYHVMRPPTTNCVAAGPIPCTSASIHLKMNVPIKNHTKNFPRPGTVNRLRVNAK